MKLDIGDKLYCHTDVNMKASGERVVTSGNFYIIKGVFDYKKTHQIFIIDDKGLNHYFDIKKHVKKYFYTYNEYRKIKLERLNEVVLYGRKEVYSKE